MPETMTIDEKLNIACQAAALRKAGKEEEGSRLLRTAPLPPYLAKIYKEFIGIEQLKKSGWNLSEAEAEFGPDWLAR